MVALSSSSSSISYSSSPSSSWIHCPLSSLLSSSLESSCSSSELIVSGTEFSSSSLPESQDGSSGTESFLLWNLDCRDGLDPCPSHGSCSWSTGSGYWSTACWSFVRILTLSKWKNHWRISDNKQHFLVPAADLCASLQDWDQLMCWARPLLVLQVFPHQQAECGNPGCLRGGTPKCGNRSKKLLAVPALIVRNTHALVKGEERQTCLQICPV